MATKDKEPKTYRYAADVAEIAKPLIKAYHSALQGVRIEYLFCSEQETLRGSKCLATASKVTGRNAYLAGDFEGQEQEPEPFFVIQVHDESWNILTEEQRIALVDHELCHCGINENDQYTMIPHDIEEFQCIVERHGLWIDNLAAFCEAALAKRDALQLELIEGDREAS